jgi:transcriptional regulator
MNRQQEVLALRERGLRNDEIAEVLGMQAGEVELILDLNLQRR